MRRVLGLGLAVSLIAIGASCSSFESSKIPFTMSVSPQFIQGALPGEPTGVLVTIENESPTDEAVYISATAVGATVTVEPTQIAAGEVAEVWLTVDPGTADGTEVELIVNGSRGYDFVDVTRSFVVFAWEDDRGEYADTLLDLFTAWLEVNRPELGITAATEFEGSFVAPQLLVVSHYLYLSEEWEIGLSWHVMIPPDDWAEIYLRPRASLDASWPPPPPGAAAPTLAFRLSSQAAALGSPAVVEIVEVPAPAEVTR